MLLGKALFGKKAAPAPAPAPVAAVPAAPQEDEDEIAAAGDKLAYIKEKKAEYTDALSGAVSAARRGYVDDIIEPDATRKRVIAALDMLFSKSEDRPFKKHGTI